MKLASVFAVWLTIGLLAIAPSSAAGNNKDYEFKLLSRDTHQGDATIVVELVHKSSGRRVPNAAIVGRRIDMRPAGMAMVDLPIALLPSQDAGIFRFKTNFTKAGPWELWLTAQIEGERVLVEQPLIIDVQP